MDDDQQFCLRWNNHQSTLISVFDTLLENETLVDCTLAAEGKYLKAHKVVLSACSPYFATLLQEQYDKHPIFILKDVKYQELRAMMDYMYRGEVNISQDQLAALLKAAESLQIKGLSDNRSGGSASQPKPDHHRASMPGKLSGGYTLEQTKRARITGAGGPAIDASEMGSREGSSSPSRRRRKVRRRSIENALTDVHDNSNSSQQPTQSNASGLGAITAAASALAAAAAVAPTTAAALASTVVPLSATQQQPPQQTSSSAVSTAVPGTTLSSSKKTDNVKGSTQHQQQQDAMNTENVQGPAASATPAMDTDATDASTADKSNHKQQKSSATGASKDTSSVTGSDLVIEPKAEYDDEANDENVEDLTLDEEDMGMDDLDHNAGTSQGGEGSSQGYAPWQHDRSQDELLLATQEAQQRDPQDVTTPTSSRTGDYLAGSRPSLRLKRSPSTSSSVAAPPPPGVIKYEPTSGLDENEDKYNLRSGTGVHSELDDNDDEMENEQPCDLRLSSHFKSRLNLVSMALQQAAAAAASGDSKTAAAMAAAAMMGGGAAGSTVAAGTSGMPPATQLQHAAALHTIAAVATSHQAPVHGLQHHSFMNFPPHAGATSPKRRYSTSSAGGSGGAAGAGPTAGSLMNIASAAVTGSPVIVGSSPSGSSMNTSAAGGGSSTSAIVTPHTPSSSSSSAIGSGTAGGSGGVVASQSGGVTGPSSAGATGSSGGGTGSSGAGPVSWGGAYTCDRCGNSYARPHSLNRHVRFECGVEPKFECPICHKKSKHKHNLVLHMRTHQHR
ncbi:longitudinals lacking isoform X6 [Haematobia irritans]|uniref:longitudinals lacking isoform X6 n=1 Tax=Haematobia irritans TaxID=7368 RepID=UPI003F4FAD38